MVAQPDNRRRIGIRKLRDHLSEVIREVHDEGVTVEVTVHGNTVAEVSRPAPVLRARIGDRYETDEEREARFAEMEQRGRLYVQEKRRLTLELRATLARELGDHWPSGLSATDAVREDRHPG